MLHATNSLKLFGILNPNHGPPSRALLAGHGLAHRLLACGPLSVWASQDGHPDALTTLAVIPRSDNKMCALALARLDEPRALAKRLDLPADTDHSTLLCHAWMVFGAKALATIGGDWLLVGWDSETNELTLVRDQLGQLRLYHTTIDKHLIFSLSINQLLALPGVSRRPNVRELVLLHVIGEPETPDHSTYYQDIAHVSPGYMLQADNHRTHTVRLWDMNDLPEVRLPRDEDYVEAFLEQFERAVVSRLPAHGRAASMLSSGLDSSAVSTLAAKQLARRGERLTALTSVPLFDAEHLVHSRANPDEGWLAAKIAQSDGMEHTLVTSSGMSPVTGIRRALELRRQPVHGAVNMYWMVRILQLCKERSIPTLLSGEMGNATISRSNTFANRGAHLLSHGRAVTLAREMLLIKGWRARARITRRILTPRWFTRLQADTKMDGDPWRETCPLHPVVVRESGVWEELRSQGHAIPKAHLLGDRPLARLLLSMNIRSSSSYWEMAAPYGVAVFDPTSDLKLASFCLGIPNDQYLSHGQNKRLIRRAMRGRLPDEILDSKQKGWQAADVILRLRQSPNEMEEALAQVRNSPLASEYLDIQRMEQVWKTIQTHATPELNSQTQLILLKGLMTGLFLAECDSTNVK